MELNSASSSHILFDLDIIPVGFHLSLWLAFIASIVLDWFSTICNKDLLRASGKELFSDGVVGYMGGEYCWLYLSLNLAWCCDAPFGWYP